MLVAGKRIAANGTTHGQRARLDMDSARTTVRFRGSWRFLTIALIGSCAMGASAAQSRSDAAPRVFRLDGKHLAETKRRLAAGDQILSAALSRLEADARAALKAGPFSVVDKNVLPPGGDKHDYMSQAPYFWPNPDTANHLPYVRRDGERNPEIDKIPDHQSFGKLMSATETLALAYYFKGDEAYAAKAAQLLRVWFLDPATRMNPHLNYGQAIPGVNQGRGIGIIETSGLPKVVDAVGLLAGSKAWTKADQQGLEFWFDKYLQWLLESKHGRDEAAQKNNHGTYYDVQVASFAFFTGKRDLAARILRESLERRIAEQIEPDGRQPLEIARTKGWSYSVGNLSGFFAAAALAENTGTDLWTYSTPDGRGIRRALDWLLPFAAGEKKWAYQQITTWTPAELAPLLRQASIKYHDRKYEEVMARMSGVGPEDRLNLLYPQGAAERRPE
jgi:hypothetical protein